jgi:hypothetical protein
MEDSLHNQGGIVQLVIHAFCANQCTENIYVAYE